MVPQTKANDVQTAGENARENAGDRQIESETAVAGDTTDHPILFFDGVCGLCNGFVDFLLVRDAQHQFRFAPLQGETASRLIHAEYDSADATKQSSQMLRSIVLLEGDRQYRRSAAVVRILRRLGTGWRIVSGLLWVIPRPIRDAGYRLVAVSRYRLFGKKETCRLPTAAERERFLP